jgi:hypothetical protein
MQIGKWWDKLLEVLPYCIRHRKHCQGQGCYVMTANRKDGVPFCHCCEEERNEQRRA